MAKMRFAVIRRTAAARNYLLNIASGTEMRSRIIRQVIARIHLIAVAGMSGWIVRQVAAGMRLVAVAEMSRQAVCIVVATA
jgi:hypothetical protein